MTPEAKALKIYHARYNNRTHRAMQDAILSDLHLDLVPFDSESKRDRAFSRKPNTAHILVNLVIDACLEMTGYPAHAGKGKTLIAVMMTHRISVKTIAVVARHLAEFDKRAAEDWEHTAIAVKKISALNLAVVKSQTSAIRGPEGNASDHLVAAAANLVHLARIVLLDDPSDSYKREQLAGAEWAIGVAKEWLALLEKDSPTSE